VSNFLAIATVTATLKSILEEEVTSEVPGAKISAKPPDTIDSPPPDGLNLFLYQVTWNNGYSNLDLPARSSEGELVHRPLLGLNLHYLVTAYGSGNDDLHAHKVLASAMRVLHENPVLTRDTINHTINAQAALVGSDLDHQIEMVKLTHNPLSLEEITKLWSSFFQTRYRISVSYQATVVLLDSKKNPKPSLPVNERIVYVLPFKQPLIEKVDQQIVELTATSKIAIIGQNLKSENVTVQFGEIQKAPEIENTTDEKILVSIPSSLTAGIKPVQVVHNLKLRTGPSPYKAFKSNIVAFVLVPKITKVVTPSVSEGSDLQVDVKPAVAPGQKIEFLIGDSAISVPPISGTQSVNRLSVKIPADFLEEGQHKADFYLRIRIDEAESLLKRDNKKRFTGPFVEVTAP
jgi:Pvc16 N-terminal domain/IPT/TIG domain